MATQPGTIFYTPVFKARWVPTEPFLPPQSIALASGLSNPMPPNNQDDWFNTYRQTWHPRTDPLQSYVLYGYPKPTQSPFNVSDWFTQWRPRWVPAEPVPQNSLLTGINSPPPVNTSIDYFAVWAPRWVPDEPTPQNALLNPGIPTPAAFSYDDFFTSYRSRWLNPDLSFATQGLLYGFVSAAPFSQSDWPQIPWRPKWVPPTPDPQNPLLSGIPAPSAPPLTGLIYDAPRRAGWCPDITFPNQVIRLPFTFPAQAVGYWQRPHQPRYAPFLDVYPNVLFNGISNPIIGFKAANIVNQVTRPRFINDVTSEIGQNSISLSVNVPQLGGIFPPTFGQVYKPFRVHPNDDIEQNTLVIGAPPPVFNPFIPYPDFFHSIQFRSKFISENWVLPNDLPHRTLQIPPFGPFDYSQLFWNNWEGDKNIPNLSTTLFAPQPRPFGASINISYVPRWIAKTEDYPNILIDSSFAVPFSYDDTTGFPSEWRVRWTQSLDYPNNAENLYIVQPTPFLLNDYTPAPKWRFSPLQWSDFPQTSLAAQTSAIIPFSLSDWPNLPTYKSAQQAPVVINPIIYGIPAGTAPFMHGIDFFNYPKAFKFVPSIDTILPYNFLASIGYIAGGPGHAIIELPRRRRRYTTRNQRFKRRQELEEWAQGLRDIPQDYRS